MLWVPVIVLSFCLLSFPYCLSWCFRMMVLSKKRLYVIPLKVFQCLGSTQYDYYHKVRISGFWRTTYFSRQTALNSQYWTTSVGERRTLHLKYRASFGQPCCSFGCQHLRETEQNLRRSVLQGLFVIRPSILTSAFSPSIPCQNRANIFVSPS